MRLWCQDDFLCVVKMRKFKMLDVEINGVYIVWLRYNDFLMDQGSEERLEGRRFEIR